AAHVLNGTNVALRGGRQVAELAGAADVLIPAVEELVDRLRVVELGLRHRYFIHPGAVDVVRDAYRDPLPAGQRVELGGHEVGDAVEPGGVAGDRRVVPPAAAGTPGRGAVFVARITQPIAVLVQ